MLSDTTLERLLKVLSQSPSVREVDITGGAPELNRHFRELVVELGKLGLIVRDRCNLTVLYEPGQEDLLDFLVSNKVQICASLPCYSSQNVDAQRGNLTFEKSIKALQEMNKKGYGSDPSLGLDLVYNPLGAVLPPSQKELELKYKKELNENFGIKFNNLYCITNMPIKRFADHLLQKGYTALSFFFVTGSFFSSMSRAW
eukprot:TRINITY_DN1842_c0_g1_i4.p1 TRINITY_DN1842_c0_g1~~TRINITY_DN1842_c0_g1_i4.p1  ORF type:complete len:200 (+),score=40.68 TRINITY_DN1842_c0_g1_i4:502-1101(+)